MLSSLHIRNFKCFEDLRIGSLARVNLITGKNNTGKTSLLEAVELLARAGSYFALSDLASQRDAYDRSAGSPEESEIRAYKSLFFQSPDAPDPETAQTRLTVSSADHQGRPRNMVCWFSYFIEEYSQGQVAEGAIPKQKKPLTPQQAEAYQREGYDVQLGIRFGRSEESAWLIVPGSVSRTFAMKHDEIPCETIGSSDIRPQSNVPRWAQAFGSGLHAQAKEMIRLLIPDLEELTFIDQPRGNAGIRIPYVRLHGQRDAVPLARFGDGASRLLTLALAAVNAQNGILLIDEFENGLHYSVQRQVWEAVFRLAQALDVQVFATTHSRDCVEAFAAAAQEIQPHDALLIRLLAIAGSIEAAAFPYEDIRASLDFNLELR